MINTPLVHISGSINLNFVALKCRRLPLLGYLVFAGINFLTKESNVNRVLYICTWAIVCHLIDVIEFHNIHYNQH